MCNCQLKYANKPKLICCTAAQTAKQVQLKRVLDVEIPCKSAALAVVHICVYAITAGYV